MRTMVGHANRGKGLEQLVEQANGVYLDRRLAEVQKVAVPTKALPDRRGEVKVIRERSTVDFIGCWQGKPIAFDCKMNRKATLFPLDSVHHHQVGFLGCWEDVGGIGFMLIWHEPDQAVYLLPYRLLAEYWNAWGAGGRASIPVAELRKLPRVSAGRGATLDYLGALERWLEREREVQTG